MTALPLTTTLAERLLRAGIPPTLLMDLLDPQGMKLALAAEVAEADVAAAPAASREQAERIRLRRQA